MAPGLTNQQLWQREQFIKSSALKQLGANRTIEALKGLGLGIQRKAGLAAYRAYGQIPEKEARMKYVRKGYRFSRDMYTRETRFMTRRYRYTMKFETRDKRTGEISEHATSVISDKPMSPGQVEQIADEAFKGITDVSPVIITKMWHHIAEHREGDAWDF